MKRQKVSMEELLKILNDELSKYEECIDCHFDSVLPHDPDAEGRNWDKPILQCAGRLSDPCTPIAAKIVIEARRKYILITK